MADDYYGILGVSKSASNDEIRKAYRKLARVNHPDAKPNDSKAAERFKEIQNAYDVLNDPEKRKLYDQFGPNFQNFAGGGSGPQPGARGPGGFSGFQSGPIDLGDLFGGGGGGGIDLGDFFSSMGGGGGPQGTRRGKKSVSRGEDIRATVQVPFATAVSGGSVDLQIDRGGKVETLAIKIPAGVNSGQIIRLAGQGQPGARGGQPGNLLLQLEIIPHPYFRREGSNLLIDVPITPSEAVIGTKVDVPTLSEGQVVVRIPPGTSSGTKLRLRGKGVIDPQSKAVGDQFVVIKIVLPKNLSEHDKSLYKQLAEHETPVREGLW